MATTDVTAERLREILHYDPQTGVFTWLVRRGCAEAGSVAGNANAAGRITIYVDGHPYRAPRLAWLYVYGVWPQKSIGYKNRDCRDIRIGNLMDWANPTPKVKKPRDDLTAERLRELVEYDPITGVFIRRVKLYKTGVIGEPIGCVNAAGRVELSIDGGIYFAHRIAWLYMTGKWPANVIDHIDGDPLNNTFRNLRDVTQFGNMQNQRRPSRNNTSGYLGVRKKRNRWAATITTLGKVRNIGVFDTPEEAHAAYLEAKRTLHATCTI